MMESFETGLHASSMKTPAPAQVIQDTALLELGMSLKRRGYHFISVTPATHTLVNNRPGNEWAARLEDIFGWSRPFQASLIPTELMTLMQDAGILAPQGEGWRSRLRASTIDDALFFHSSYPTTEADAVFFGPDTYRYTNAIVQYLSSNTKPVQRVADIGCGAGPGAITVAQLQPQAEVLAIDINDQALRLTRVNAMLAGVDHVQPLHSNLLDATEGAFDLIIANPPYLLDPTRRAYRHGGGALGEGLSLAIVDAAIQRLGRHGTLLLYTGVAIEQGVDPFRNAALERLEHAGFEYSYREIDPDVFGEELFTNPSYSDTDRIAAVVLTAKYKN